MSKLFNRANSKMAYLSYRFTYEIKEIIFRPLNILSKMSLAT